MDIINLTPHSITFMVDGKNLTIEPSGTVARLTVTTVTTGTINGIPVTESRFGEIENLPPMEEGKCFIVSSLVAGRVPDRRDVFIPNESIRDENGRIIGCKSLGHL